MKLSTILLADRFPHQAKISLGDGSKLVVTYRAVPPDADRRVEAWIQDQLAALGFDPEVGLRAMKGHVPTGEDGAAFEEAFRALGDDAGDAIASLGKRGEGYALSLLLGSWSLITAKGETEPLDDAIDADTCAALPGDLKQAIVTLAQSAALPTEGASFLATSPRS